MSTHNLDRKELKRPDQFMESVTQFFNELSKHPRILMTLFGVVLVAGATVMIWQSRHEARSNEAKNALFWANQAVEEGIKRAIPPAVIETLEVAETKDKKNKTKPALPMSEPVVEKIDVDAKLGEAVQKLKAVTDKYSGTQAAFEAAVSLGDLYLKNGQVAKAIPWLQKASETAPNHFQKALVMVSLGNAYENDSKFNEALATYEKSNTLGQSSLQGELLLGLGRVAEKMKDVQKAKSFYDQVISKLPNTEYSKTAELYKAGLQ